MMYDHGISREGDLIDLGLAAKLIEKSGSWLNYGEQRLGQGRENAKQLLRDNPEISQALTQAILAKHKAGGVGDAGETASD
jgi:recombination protein RecA